LHAQGEALVVKRVRQFGLVIAAYLFIVFCIGIAIGVLRAWPS
jgi:phosphotransferase system  glucose/maltose/N-acetylglucosamine-specific IIC component